MSAAEGRIKCRDCGERFLPIGSEAYCIVCSVPQLDCGRCKKPITMTRNPDGGYTLGGMQFCACGPDGTVSIGKTLTCDACIAAHPEYRPELGRPWRTMADAREVKEREAPHVAP